MQTSGWSHSSVIFPGAQTHIRHTNPDNAQAAITWIKPALNRCSATNAATATTATKVSN
jgi:hypothetical protein